MGKLTAFQAEVKPFVSGDLLPPKNELLVDTKNEADKQVTRMALTHFEAELYVALVQTVGKPKARHGAVSAAHTWVVENAEDVDPSKCHALLWQEASRIMKGDSKSL